jgi:hypothetical protein
LTRTNPFINRGFVAVIQAEFQADAVLAHRAVNKLTDVIISADSDLAVLVGPSCCLVKQYKYSQCQNKANPMYNIDMAFSSMNVLNNLLHNMVIDSSSQKTTKSKHPFFELILDPKTRCLAAIALGADVFPKGIQGLWKKDFYQFLEI